MQGPQWLIERSHRGTSGHGCLEFNAQDAEGRGQGPCGIHPDGAGAALPKLRDRFDERGGVIWPNQPVVDRVLQTIWAAGPLGETPRQLGSIKVEYELEKPRAVSLGQPLKVLNEGGSGELTYDEVESARNCSLATARASRLACSPEAEGSSPQHPQECLSPSLSNPSVIGLSCASACAIVDLPEPGASLIKTRRVMARR
jgi:hypothetical protein